MRLVVACQDSWVYFLNMPFNSDIQTLDFSAHATSFSNGSTAGLHTCMVHPLPVLALCVPICMCVVFQSRARC